MSTEPEQQDTEIAELLEELLKKVKETSSVQNQEPLEHAEQSEPLTNGENKGNNEEAPLSQSPIGAPGAPVAPIEEPETFPPSDFFPPIINFMEPYFHPNDINVLKRNYLKSLDDPKTSTPIQTPMERRARKRTHAPAPDAMLDEQMMSSLRRSPAPKVLKICAESPPMCISPVGPTPGQFIMENGPISISSGRSAFRAPKTLAQATPITSDLKSRCLKPPSMPSAPQTLAQALAHATSLILNSQEHDQNVKRDAAMCISSALPAPLAPPETAQVPPTTSSSQNRNIKVVAPVSKASRSSAPLVDPFMKEIQRSIELRGLLALCEILYPDQVRHIYKLDQKAEMRPNKVHMTPNERLEKIHTTFIKFFDKEIMKKKKNECTFWEGC